MATEDQALAAYRELKAKLGRVPTNPELAETLGLKGTYGAKAQAAAALRKSLVAKGLAEPATRGGARPSTTAKPAAPAPKPRTAPAPRVAAPAAPPRRTSKDPTVAALIERRDALLHKANALDVAIEALSEAL